jgi:peptidoglycan/LPS O-acetylase OafA/YrhL
LALTVVLAGLVYAVVERPGIDLGRALTARRREAAPAQSACGGRSMKKNPR